MAAGLIPKALRRATVVRQPAIRDALAQEDSRRAVTEALAYLRAELTKVRKHRRADGALIDAQLAGSITWLAATLHSRKPDRLPGWPRVPRAEHLTEAYEAAIEAARAAAEGKENE